MVVAASTRYRTQTSGLRLSMVVAIVAAAGLASAARSDASNAADDLATSPVTALSITAPEGDEAATYWTPERMASATPVDVVVAAGAAPTPTVTKPGDDGLGPVRYHPKLAPTESADLVAHLTAILVKRPYTNLPDRTIGKVFFTDAGGDHSCSGVALNSTNKSVVWTAGHCVEAGLSGGFHSRWVFVPGYGSCSNSCRPFGTFRATTLMTTTGWAQTGDFRVDLGAAVVARIGGRKLGQIVGGQGFAASESGGKIFRNVGYPADPPFSGRRQLQCTGEATGRDVGLPGTGPPPVAMACDMTGGASGGPWLIDLGRNGYGYVNGSNSYRYRNDQHTLYSPYFGDEAVELFLRVSTAPVR